MKRLCSAFLSVGALAATSSLPLSAQTVADTTAGGLVLDTMTEALIRPAEQKLGIRVVADASASRHPEGKT